MSRRNADLRLAIGWLRLLCLGLAVACIALQVGVSPVLVKADSSLGISGSFTDQLFEIPLGGSVSGPSIDVRVFNNSSDEMKITMSTVAPSGVTVSLEPADNFTLPPQSQLQLLITVDVSTLAELGAGQISVIADSSHTPAGGVAIQESARLNANITVVGDSGTVIARTVSLVGDSVVAQVRLFRVIGTTNYEIAYSDNGTVQALVSPGNYIAYAYKNGELLGNSDQFAVAKDQNVEVPITVRTVYITAFSVQPQYLDSGKLSQAQITYTVVNLEREMAKGEVRLSVTHGGVLLETVTILSVDPLKVQRVGNPYFYAPAAGWEKGTYGFGLQLYAEGGLKAETLEQTLKVGEGGVASWLWIIFVILGVIGAAGLGFVVFFLLKRRRKEEEKPRKEKKQKEEKPPRTLQEPVPKPEPVRSVPPPPIEEPIEEPTPLASISSLKARMASLGQDQGVGKPAEEEAEAVTQEAPEETMPQAIVTAPVPPLPDVEPQQPAAKKVEEKVQKTPASQRPVGQKPSIFSKVTVTGKQEPPKPPGAQGPAPVKPDSGVQINWPPKPVEPAKPPPVAEPEVETPPALAPPEAAPTEEAAPGEEPSEPVPPLTRSSLAEAARLRMEARQRAAEKGRPDAAPGKPPDRG